MESINTFLEFIQSDLHGLSENLAGIIWLRESGIRFLFELWHYYKEKYIIYFLNFTFLKEMENQINFPLHWHFLWHTEISEYGIIQIVSLNQVGLLAVPFVSIGGKEDRDCINLSLITLRRSWITLIHGSKAPCSNFGVCYILPPVAALLPEPWTISA